MANKALVVDANILVRAVLGKRVREVIRRTPSRCHFSSRKVHTPKPKSICLPSQSNAAVIRERF